MMVNLIRFTIGPGKLNILVRGATTIDLYESIGPTLYVGMQPGLERMWIPLSANLNVVIRLRMLLMTSNYVACWLR